MFSDPQSATLIVKAAFNDDTSLAHIVGMEPETVSAVCKAHRIHGPLFARLRSIPDRLRSAFHQRLMQQLLDEHRLIYFAALDHAEVIARIQAACIPFTDLSLLKGNTLFFLTGHSLHARQTGDVDLILANPDQWEAVQSALGGELVPGHRLDIHEIGCLRYADLDVDVHRFCQIIARPGLDNDQTDVPPYEAANNGIRGDTISFSELCLDREQALNAEVKILGPTAAALLNVTHGYRDYVKHSSVTSRQKPPMRAGDLFELASFVAHPHFQADLFRKIVEHRKIQEQVGVMAYLLARHFGSKRLMEITGLGSSYYEQPFAAKLIFNCIWAPILNLDHFAVHESPEAVVRGLLGSTVGLGPHAPARNIPNGRGAQALRHVDTEGNEIQLSIRVQPVEGDLIVYLSPIWTSVQRNRRLHIEIDGHLCEWNFNFADTKVWFKHSDGGAKRLLNWQTLSDGSHEVRFRGPFNNMSSVIFAAGEFAQAPNVIVCGVVIPCILEFHM